MMDDTPSGPSIAFKFSDPSLLLASDLSNFLYSLNKIYVLSVWDISQSFGNPYASAPFVNRTGSNWQRNYYRLPPGMALVVKRIRFESPGFLEVVIPYAVPAATALGAVWTIIQICEKLADWPEARLRFRMETEKLRLENSRIAFELQQNIENARYQKAGNSMARTGLKIEDIDLRLGPMDRI